MSSCLPPDFEIAPDQNLPVQIDRALVTPPVDVVHTLAGCPPLPLLFSVDSSLVNEDGDRLYSAWLVNYRTGQGGRPDASSLTGPRDFEFDPCTNSKVLTGSSINTVELFILDRPPESFESGDGFKTIVDPETTTANVVWFIAVEDLSCCKVTN